MYYASKKKDLVLELASLLGCFALAGGECTLQASKLRLLQPRWFQVAMTLDKLFPALQLAHCDVSWLIADLLPQPASLHCLWPAWASLGLPGFAWLACKAAALLRSSSQSKTKASRLRDLSAFVCNAATQCAEARINSMNKKRIV